MVVVHLHPKGVVVVPDAHTRPSEVGRRLRKSLASDQLFPIGGRFVVPTTSIAAVADSFDPEEITWDEGVWELVLEQRRRHEAVAIARLRSEAVPVDSEAMKDANSLAQLDPHQVQAVMAMSTAGLLGLALFDEQGTGKTISTLAAFDRLYDEGTIKRLLVVAPKSVLGAWKEDAAKLFSGKYQLVTVEGTAARRRQLIRSKHDILVVTYDGVVRDRLWLEIRLSAERDAYMLALDESYLVKNSKTSRALALATLRPYCERAIVLCGTPAPNSARDVVNQVDLADRGLAFGHVVLPRNEERARELVKQSLQHAVMLRRLKEEVLPDIPEKTFERLYIDLQPVQHSLYENARRNLVDDVLGINQREFSRRLTSFLARRAMLLQICSHPGVFATNYPEEPAKLLALDRLLEQLVQGQGLKVVIWSFFRFTLSAIADRYASLGLVRIDGTIQSSRVRAGAIERFQHDPAVRVFLGNPAAAGAGITLTAAHHVVYESFSNQTAHYLQSVDRVHRRGQDYDVVNHILVASNTLEDAEFARLLRKEQMARDVLGDPYKELEIRERFLADLGVSEGSSDSGELV